jgi:MFS family permease
MVAPIFPVIEEEFGWTSENADLYLGLAASSTVVGNALANFFGFLTANQKPSRVILITKFTYLAALCLCLYKNTWVLISARFVMGIALGFQFPPAISTMFQISPNRLKGVVGGIFAIVFSFGLMSGFGVGALVNKGTISWRLMYLMVVLISLVDFLIQWLYIKRDLSPVYMFKTKVPKEKFYKILGSYLTPSVVDQKFKECQEASQPINTETTISEEPSSKAK